MRILKLTKETQNNILENLLKRSPNSYGEFESRVNDIIQNVREKRDEAIFEYTLKFDGATIDQDNIRVTEEEIKEAYEQVDPKAFRCHPQGTLSTSVTITQNRNSTPGLIPMNPVSY